MGRHLWKDSHQYCLISSLYFHARPRISNWGLSSVPQSGFILLSCLVHVHTSGYCFKSIYCSFFPLASYEYAECSEEAVYINMEDESTFKILSFKGEYGSIIELAGDNLDLSNSIGGGTRGARGPWPPRFLDLWFWPPPPLPPRFRSTIYVIVGDNYT